MSKRALKSLSKESLKQVTGGGADIPRTGGPGSSADGSKLGWQPPVQPDFPRSGGGGTGN